MNIQYKVTKKYYLADDIYILFGTQMKKICFQTKKPEKEKLLQRIDYERNFCHGYHVSL